MYINKGLAYRPALISFFGGVRVFVIMNYVDLSRKLAKLLNSVQDSIEQLLVVEREFIEHQKNYVRKRDLKVGDEVLECFFVGHCSAPIRLTQQSRNSFNIVNNWTNI